MLGHRSHPAYRGERATFGDILQIQQSQNGSDKELPCVRRG
jgi:hypothetical protein